MNKKYNTNKISVITPSYNQAAYLERTIDSVLSQKGVDIEYIIIDGGSSDSSVDIIRKYEKYLKFWVSEPDLGQSNAINKGLHHSTGEIWCYLNSDDYFLPETLHSVASCFQRHRSVLWVTGYGRYIDDNGNKIEDLIPSDFTTLRDSLIRWNGTPHPISIEVSNFMRREVLDRYGYFDENLHYCMDFDFNLRLLFNGIRPSKIHRILACATLHSKSKTITHGRSGAFMDEDIVIIDRYLPLLSIDDQKYVTDQVRSARIWKSLSEVESLRIQSGRTAGISKLTSIVWKYPEILLRRAAWGQLKRCLHLR